MPSEESSGFECSESGKTYRPFHKELIISPSSMVVGSDLLLKRMTCRHIHKTVGEVLTNRKLANLRQIKLHILYIFVQLCLTRSP